jgi:hypothetical protein
MYSQSRGYFDSPTLSWARIFGAQSFYSSVDVMVRPFFQRHYLEE